MPPPLSAYFDFASGSGSDSCPPTAQEFGSQAVQGDSAADVHPLSAAKASKVASKKRKGKGLLAGIRLENIVAATCEEGEQLVLQETLPTSSATKSSLRTRRQTNIIPLYDQKYHPMDDILQPSRAAKHYARYEDRLADDSEATDSGEDAIHDRYANKRRKLSVKPSTEGVRRSTRHTNRDVPYDTQAHPQDGEINQETADHMDVESDHDLASSSAGGYSGLEPQVITESDDTSSEWSSSPPRSSPLSFVALASFPASQAQVDSYSFQVYEEHMQIQLYSEMSHVTLTTEHDSPDSNKENIPPGSEHDSTAVHDNDLAQITGAIVEAAVEEQLETAEFASNPEVPSTFDGALDAMEENQENIPPQALTQGEAADERDSVLGTLTPSPLQTNQRDSASPGVDGASRGSSHRIELRR